METKNMGCGEIVTITFEAVKPLEGLIDLMVRSQHDVIVAGGGTAGVAAAVASGRNGADTILIERYGFLGGTMTAGLVNPFMPFHAGGEQIIRGIFQEMIDRLKEIDGYDEDTKAFDA